MSDLNPKMNEIRNVLIFEMKKVAALNRQLSEMSKEFADTIPSQIDARAIYNTLGPLDAAAQSLDRAIGRLEA